MSEEKTDVITQYSSNIGFNIDYKKETKYVIWGKELTPLARHA